MPDCPKCGAHLEWKSTRDISQPDKKRFLSHPKGGCHEFIRNKLKNKCNLLDQDFRTPRTCEEGCNRQIFCFETKTGSALSKIYFDTPGPPWIKHDCNNKPTLAAQMIDYKPCVINEYISITFAAIQGKEHLLGFQIQIQAVGFRKQAFIAIESQEDNQQFVRQLHQPFFYKELGPHDWTLNTYQESFNESSEPLCMQKEYKCKKIDHEEIRGWMDDFGDDKQHSLNID